MSRPLVAFGFLVLAGCPSPRAAAVRAPSSVPRATAVVASPSPPKLTADSAPRPADAAITSTAEQDVVREIAALLDFLAGPVTVEDIVGRVDGTEVTYRAGEIRMTTGPSTWLEDAKILVSEGAPALIVLTLQAPIGAAALQQEVGELDPFLAEFGGPWVAVSADLDRGGAYRVSLELEVQSWKAPDVATMRGKVIILARRSVR